MTRLSKIHGPYVYTFYNSATQQTIEIAGESLNQAARALNIEVPYRGRLPQPWRAIKCSINNEVIWEQE